MGGSRYGDGETRRWVFFFSFFPRRKIGTESAPEEPSPPLCKSQKSVNPVESEGTPDPALKEKKMRKKERKSGNSHRWSLPPPPPPPFLCYLPPLPFPPLPRPPPLPSLLPLPSLPSSSLPPFPFPSPPPLPLPPNMASRGTAEPRISESRDAYLCGRVRELDPRHPSRQTRLSACPGAPRTGGRALQRAGAEGDGEGVPSAVCGRRGGGGRGCRRWLTFGLLFIRHIIPKIGRD